jgi:CRISP-associated protein Cas1
LWQNPSKACAEDGYAFDIMEPERAKVDMANLRFVRQMVFHPADFVLRSDGVARVSPQLARVIAALNS